MASAWGTGVHREAGVWENTDSDHQNPEGGSHRESYNKPPLLAAMFPETTASSSKPSGSHSSSHEQPLKPEPCRIRGNVVPSLLRMNGDEWSWAGKRHPGDISCWDSLALPGGGDRGTECLEGCRSLHITSSSLHIRNSNENYDLEKKKEKWNDLVKTLNQEEREVPHALSTLCDRH